MVNHSESALDLRPRLSRQGATNGFYLPKFGLERLHEAIHRLIHKGEPGEGGFWAATLELPGANGQGETREECLDNLKQAIQLLLETAREEAFRLDPDAEITELVLT